MRKAKVFLNGEVAGELCEISRNNFSFIYFDEYFNDNTKTAISLTLPKKIKEHYSEHLFPFFYNLLSEGTNKKLQCRLFRIDENDSFGLLLATAKDDTIGAVTVEPTTE